MLIIYLHNKFYILRSYLSLVIAMKREGNINFMAKNLIFFLSKLDETLWDLRFSRRWRWRCCSSKLWRRVDSKVDTNVSEKHTVSFFRAESIFIPGDGDSVFLRNVDIYLRVYTASQPWWDSFSRRKIIYFSKDSTVLIPCWNFDNWDRIIQHKPDVGKAVVNLKR
jgi:hypothetical protein